ncbi:hypothetical protein [Bdellovibrio sp.]|uniref:hypothetical protein n=1 Tax=Bdellovibrio sp. TaxID=28201 RepID=UPI0039E5C568
MNDSHRKLYQERDFLHDIGVSLNAALFIVDRLTEEIKEEEGRLETDAEIEKLFHHLANYLVKIDGLVKTRNTHLSELLDEEIQKEKRERSQNTPSISR